MANIKDLLNLFFSFSSVERSKSMYARQTIQLKKLVLEYGEKDLERVLTYLSENKDKYKISSLAYLPYIFSEVLSLTYENEGKKDIMFTEVDSSTNNKSKSSKFGEKKEDWSEFFASNKR